MYMLLLLMFMYFNRMVILGLRLGFELGEEEMLNSECMYGSLMQGLNVGGREMQEFE